MKLGDTYNRVNYEIYGYEDVHIRLRDECDDMEHCNETVKFVRAMIQNIRNTNIFYERVENVQIQQGTQNSLQQAGNVANRMKGTIIEKERTSVNEILKSKAYECVVACILFVVALILYNVLTKEMLDKIQSNIKIFLLFIIVIFL